MAAIIEANKLITEWLANDPSAEITPIEKSVDGRVTIEEISGALHEYAKLFKAGYSSPAQILTLHRAYPSNVLYSEAVTGQNLLEKDPNVVGGPASVEMIDREGHLITTNALSKAFDNYMKNPMTRNVMVMHSDIQVGWALPAYISKSGQIYKSGMGGTTLFFITELRDDTKIAKRVIEEIKKSRMKSYSIAGSAIRTENVSGNMFKGEPPYMRVDELELAEVTICEKGVNQGAGFDLIKSNKPEGSCADESCFVSKGAQTVGQETETMSFDDYKNLLTSRDGKSFAKMFSEYTYMYKQDEREMEAAPVSSPLPPGGTGTGTGGKKKRPPPRDDDPSDKNGGYSKWGDKPPVKPPTTPSYSGGVNFSEDSTPEKAAANKKLVDQMREAEAIKHKKRFGEARGTRFNYNRFKSDTKKAILHTLLGLNKSNSRFLSRKNNEKDFVVQKLLGSLIGGVVGAVNTVAQTGADAAQADKTKAKNKIKI